MDNPQEHQNEPVHPEGSEPVDADSAPKASPEASESGQGADPNTGQPSAADSGPTDSSALHEAMAAESEQTMSADAEASGVQMPDMAEAAPRAEFGPLGGEPQITDRQAGNISLLLDVKLPVAIELGRTRMSINEILELGSGSIVELDKLAGEPVDILVNNKPLAKGEVVVLDENFGVRITSLVSPRERLERLNNQ